jgi:hypothetical protein
MGAGIFRGSEPLVRLVWRRRAIKFCRGEVAGERGSWAKKSPFWSGIFLGLGKNTGHRNTVQLLSGKRDWYFNAPGTESADDVFPVL